MKEKGGPAQAGAPGAAGGETRDHGTTRTPVDPDAQLMLAFQQGDERCFDTLFQKHKTSVINFAYRFTGRRDRAEELAQDIFVKCYRAAPGYRPEARFTTWLFRIARNHCLNEVRRPEYRMTAEPLDHPGVQPRARDTSPEARARQRDLQRLLERALADLPERQRTALILSRFDHLSYEEIAATMGVSLGAVKSLLNRARVRLMAFLEEHGEVAREL